jgi:hypothetical protein
VLITVLVNGGGTYSLLKRWNLQDNDAQPSSRCGFELAPLHGSTPTNGDLAQPVGSPPVSCNAFGTSNLASRCAPCAGLQFQSERDSGAPALRGAAQAMHAFSGTQNYSHPTPMRCCAGV